MFVSQGQGHPSASLLAQAHSGAAGLGLYPILWQYPNGTPTSYSPGLNLSPAAKWVHPENPVTVNSEATLRRVGVTPVTQYLYLNCIFPLMIKDNGKYREMDVTFGRQKNRRGHI